MLDDDAIARYARQIVVPGIGPAGQLALMRATVLVTGSVRGVAQARLYLDAAGVTTSEDPTAPADVVLVAGVADLAPVARRDLATAARPVCWYVLDEDGFTAGVHPQAPLPLHAAAHTGKDAEGWHDAAACDAAAVACAILIGLDCRPGPLRFGGGTPPAR